MNSIGQTLRRARIERGLALEDVAARTRINPRHLEAIEADNRAAIPGIFFYRSFARQYASFLSADTAAAIERMLALEEPPGEAQPHHEILTALAAVPKSLPNRMPRTSNRPAITSVVLLLAALLGTSGLYAWWNKARRVQTVAAPPVVKAAPQRETPVVVSPAVSKQPELVTASAAPAANEGDSVVLQIAATEPTWLSFSADGKRVFSGTLQIGESKIFQARENARMTVGNAGGLEVKLNGKPTGPLGPHAQVRNVVFTPAGFQVVKPAPKPPEDEAVPGAVASQSERVVQPF